MSKVHDHDDARSTRTFCDVTFLALSLLLLLVFWTSNVTGSILILRGGSVIEFYLWLCITITAHVLTSLTSMTLHLNSERSDREPDDSVSKGAKVVVWLIHVTLIPVLPWRLWTLLKLKHSSTRSFIALTADLCLLRGLYAILGALPSACIYLYVELLSLGHNWSLGQPLTWIILIAVLDSAWCLACISRRLVWDRPLQEPFLNWFGLLCKFAWRFAALTSRIFALVLYSAVYNWYVIMVLIFHCGTIGFAYCLILWKRAKMVQLFKFIPMAALGGIFDWVHLSSQGSFLPQLVAFYSVTFAENFLLALLWYRSARNLGEYHYKLFLCLVFLGAFFAVLFMVLYYVSCTLIRMFGSAQGVPRGGPVACRLTLNTSRKKSKLPSKFNIETCNNNNNNHIENTDTFSTRGTELVEPSVAPSRASSRRSFDIETAF